MERIKKYFKREYNQDAEIIIKDEKDSPCPHCRCGDTYIGTAIFNSNNDEEIYQFDFEYWTGCLTFDEELDYI